MKKFLYILIVLIIGSFFALEFKKSIAPTMSQSDLAYVVVGDTTILVEIADETKEYWQGLSDREYLSEDSGMLFIFPQKQVRSFWMKNMKFPVDIIWIQGDKVVKIDTNLAPEGENPKNKYKTIQKVDRVLEVNSGFVDKYNIKTGDVVKYYY